MRAILAGALGYALAMALPGLAISATILASQEPRRPDALGDFLVVLYITAIATALSTAGFLLPTAWSSRWRRVTATRAAVISGLIGLIAPFASLFIAGAGATLMLHLFRTAPLAATAIFHGSGGVALGALAVLVVFARRVRE